MKRIDIMLDLETLGIVGDVPIIQISAIAFDIISGEHIGKFDQKIKISDNLTINKSTLKWWLQTDAKLLESILSDGNASEAISISNFISWINATIEEAGSKELVYLWGNGILFDNRIIHHKCEKYGYKYPIFYRNDRDLRTLLELACMKTEKDFDELKKSAHSGLVQHDALDDCRAQIILASYSYNALIS